MLIFPTKWYKHTLELILGDKIICFILELKANSLYFFCYCHGELISLHEKNIISRFAIIIPNFEIIIAKYEIKERHYGYKLSYSGASRFAQ